MEDTRAMFDREEIDRWRRQLNTILVQAGHDDPEGFAQVAELLAEAQAGLADTAAMLREPSGAAPGHSWADLARPLGMARQSAAEKYGRRRLGHLGCAHCGPERIIPRSSCPSLTAEQAAS